MSTQAIFYICSLLMFIYTDISVQIVIFFLHKPFYLCRLLFFTRQFYLCRLFFIHRLFYLCTQAIKSLRLLIFFLFESFKCVQVIWLLHDILVLMTFFISARNYSLSVNWSMYAILFHRPFYSGGVAIEPWNGSRESPKQKWKIHRSG